MIIVMKNVDEDDEIKKLKTEFIDINIESNSILNNDKQNQI